MTIRQAMGLGWMGLCVMAAAAWGCSDPPPPDPFDCQVNEDCPEAHICCPTGGASPRCVPGDAQAECPFTEAEAFTALAPAEPLELEPEMLGVGVHHGELLAFEHNDPEDLAAALRVFHWGVLHVQSYDERAYTFGEHTWFLTPSGQPGRTAEAFVMQRTLGALTPRTADLQEEIRDAANGVSAPQFEQQAVVVDFWRTRGDWFIRWDGLLQYEEHTRGRSAFGFARQAFVQEMRDELVSMAAAAKPDVIIVGREMERLLATDEAGGLSAGEWLNFATFYKEVAAAIREASPDTRVGFGINWDRFASRIAPTYDADGELTTRALDRAFQAALLPMLRHSDILALESRADFKEDVEAKKLYYGFLRRQEELYGDVWPVYYYSISTPIDSQAGYPKQRQYLEAFLEWNAGVPVEMVAWTTLLNIDGTDTGDQQIAAQCRALVDKELYEMNSARCYDGLFTTVFDPKDVYTTFSEAAGQ